MLYIHWCNTAVASQLAVYDFTLKTKPRDPTPAIVPVLIKETPNEKLNWRTGTIYAEAQNWARTVWLCPSVALGVILIFLTHSLWNYQPICLHQPCVLLTSLYASVQLNVSSGQIFCEKVVKEFEGLDNVTIHVRDEGPSFLPALSISQDSRCVSLGQGKGHAHLLECSPRYP